MNGIFFIVVMISVAEFFAPVTATSNLLSRLASTSKRPPASEVANVTETRVRSDRRIFTTLADLKASGGVEDWGYLETAYYAGTDEKGHCVNPIVKTMDLLRYCVASATKPGFSVSLWVNFYPRDNILNIYEQYYSDENCQQSDGEVVFIGEYKMATCEQNVMYQLHSPVFDPYLDPRSLNFAYGVYHSQERCEEHEWNEAYLSAIAYYPFNVCNYEGGGNDIMVTGCSNTEGITYLEFPTTNGTCGGTPKAFLEPPAVMCTSKTATVDDFAAGWENFFCSTV